MPAVALNVALVFPGKIATEAGTDTKLLLLLKVADMPAAPAADVDVRVQTAVPAAPMVPGLHVRLYALESPEGWMLRLAD